MLKQENELNKKTKKVKIGKFPDVKSECSQ